MILKQQYRNYGFAFYFFALLLILSLPVAQAATITVSPGETIQAAIDSAADGDTIVVADGTYTGAGNYDIDFNGKAITVRSQNGYENCVIDCQNNGRGFDFRSGETADSVISGFTIQNGSESRGGGFHFRGGAPTIQNCMIRSNTASEGGGIHCRPDTSPAFINCIIVNNTAQSGGGIYCHKAGPEFTNCTVVNNSASDYGDQAFFDHTSKTDQQPRFLNCIIGDGFSQNDSDSQVDYCNISGGYPGDGNIDFDSLLTSDWHLQEGSPCIDAGTAIGAPAEDIDGEVRPVGNGVDIGADEFPVVDTDADGLPDSWENTFFGSLNQGPDDDPDGDGLTNLEEFQYGSKPDAPPIMVAPGGAIQAAIDQAADGDTVLVEDGTYTGAGNFNIDFSGKSIIVASENGYENCIIDCQNNDRGFYFHSGETDNSVLIGFTIENGSADDGGGICCDNNSSPTIQKCLIRNNTTADDGAGIYCDNGAYPVVINCIIVNNTAQSSGGGIGCKQAGPEFINCTIKSNNASDSGDQFFADQTLTVEQQPSFVNCIIGSGFYTSDSTPQVKYCNISGGHAGEGNVEVEPLLSADWHLLESSPCIDAGTEAKAPATDITGMPRPQLTGVDMGAYEYATDYDGDGMADAWEYTHFGTILQDPEDDPDNDGFTNLQEHDADPQTCPSCGDHLTVTVDDWYIQEAIDRVNDGGTVLVQDGTYTGPYNKDLDFKGRDITVISENGPNNSIIDCQNEGRGVYFHSAETADAVFSGFTIQNGMAEIGGAILCDNASPTISNCDLINNQSTNSGGGISCKNDSAALIKNCRINDNSAVNGGGINVSGSVTAPVLVTACTITNNSADEEGGGIRYNTTQAQLDTCLLAENESSTGGGVQINGDFAQVDVSSCTISNNIAGMAGSQVNCTNTGTQTSLTFINSIIWSDDDTVSVCDFQELSPDITYCDIKAEIAGEGNFNEDPKFETDRYYLNYSSPCVDAGYASESPAADIVGIPRPQGESIDMGAYEFSFDCDGDGMPDKWERENGLDQLDPADAYEDPDGDGVVNLLEYKNGTDPNVPDSDVSAPQIAITYPANDSNVMVDHEGTTDLIVAFGDVGFGVKNAIIEDENGEVTSNVTTTQNSIILTGLAPGQYDYTLTITDYHGNETVSTISFTVEEAIQTTVEPAGETYNMPQNVRFTCNKDNAVVFYSTDGYPPQPGAGNTTELNAEQAGVAVPSEGITIDKTLCLQFFAKINQDEGALQKEIYYLNDLPPAPVNLTKTYDETTGVVSLTWTAVGAGSAYRYHVYRCDNAVEKQILQDSIDGGYPPPLAQLGVGEMISDASYTETVPTTLAHKYWYAVAAVKVDESNDLVGMATEPVLVEITPTSAAGNSNEAVDKAIAWLESTQHTQGFWDERPSRRIPATCQSINGINADSRNLTAINFQKALYYLRGQYADNNDYLARKILTLSAAGQNVDMLAALLFANRNSIKAGWGMQYRYDIDALDTSLGILALESIYPDQSLTEDARLTLENDLSLRSGDGIDLRFGWVPGKEASVFVSALVYNVLGKNTQADIGTYQWIIDEQTTAPYGKYFGSGMADTAAALLWLDIPDTPKADAIDYLVSQQQVNGSWDDDPYLTGLCVEALAGSVD